MQNLNSLPLVVVPSEGPQGEPVEGSLVTVRLFGGKESGARITRIAHGTYFVRLCGLTVPEGYSIGQALPLSRDKIIDWE